MRGRELSLELVPAADTLLPRNRDGRVDGVVQEGAGTGKGANAEKSKSCVAYSPVYDCVSALVGRAWTPQP